MPTGPARPARPNLADLNDRFVAFAFAGADMVAESDLDGTLTYAAGAFPSKFGRPSDSFIGQSLRDLVAPVDHEALDAALALLIERGRLPPFVIRLADPGRSCLSLAGISLPSPDRTRLCLTFARPPAPASAVLRVDTRQSLARAAEARMRGGTPCDLGLLEIVGEGMAAHSAGDAIGQALEKVASGAVASELAPGRFGLLGNGGTETDLLSVASLLESTLQSQGLCVGVTARHVPLGADALTPTQAARALRQALNAFACDGSRGLTAAGLANGLAGYMRQAERRAGALRRAIQDGQFGLMFQPIVSLADGATHHYEALIRPRPIVDCPLAGPQEFVMLVEALGLAGELDLAVARLACDAAAQRGVSVAFNVSGQSVQDEACVEGLVDLLRGHRARDLGLVLVEMTETAEIEDLRQASQTADALRSLNVPFCLDDFGAGAADVRLLRALTADIVKLDGSYVPGIASGGRERAFVAGMVEIARAGGAALVAERIETAAEADAVRALGVKYGQGWLFGRPKSELGTHRAASPASKLKLGKRVGATEVGLTAYRPERGFDRSGFGRPSHGLVAADGFEPPTKGL